MANKEAIISKVQKENYVSGTSKKTVYPVTLDEAVKVKKEDGKTYTTLTKALNSKFGDAIVLGFWQDLSSEERTQEYYMFTFRHGRDMEGRIQGNSINYKETLIKALTCSNEEFIDLCVENEDEDGEDINMTLQPQTVASLKDRVHKSKYLNSLYLRMIHLHGTDIPTIYLKDEDNNIYKSGDTLNFTSYPAKLWLCADNINPEYVDFVEKVFLDSSQGIVHHLKIYSNEVSDNTELTSGDPTEVEMHFNDHAANTSEIPYENPLFTPRYYGDTISILPASNEFTNIILNEGFVFYVMPSDYPYDGNEEEVSNYCTQAKQGIFYINDVFKGRGTQNESINPIGFPSSYFNIIFTPEQDEDEIKPFALDQLQSKPVIIRKSDRWMCPLKIKGVNATSSLSVSIYRETGDPTRFVFKRLEGADADEIPNEGYEDTLVLSPEEVNEGTVLLVRPDDWEDNKMYVPFSIDHETLIERNIRLTYEDEVVKLVPLKCIINAEDIPHTDDPIVEEYEEETFSNYDYYCLVRVPDSWNSLRITAISVNSAVSEFRYTLYYVSVTDSLYEDVEGGININNIVSNVAARLEEPIKIERIGATIVTSERKYILFKINVFSGNETSPLSGVNGKLEIQREPALDESIKIIYGNSSSQSHSISSEYPSSSFQNYIQMMTLPSWEGFNPSGITGRLTNYYMANNIVEVPKLREYKELPNGVFSGLQSLEDASFMQYMDILTAVPKHAFSNCSNLSNVVLPSDITTIDDYAFAGCTSLESLVIPDSVTHIGRGICQGCTALTEVEFGAGLTDVTSIYGFTDSPLTDIWVRSEILPFIEPPYGLGIETPTFSSDITGENSDSVTLHFLPEIKIPIQDEELHVIGYDTVTLTDGETVEESPIANTPWGLFPNATIRLIEVE